MGVGELSCKPARRGFPASGLADFNERAGGALGFFVEGWWGDAGIEDFAGAGSYAKGQLAEPLIERDLCPAVGLAVEEEAERDLRKGKHLLQTNRLGAKLNLVRAVAFGFSPLVFHRDDPPVAVELDDIALPGEAERGRGDGNSTHRPDVATGFSRSLVRALVQNPSLRRLAVLAPLAVEVDQRKLPLAEEGMLQSGDRDRGHLNLPTLEANGHLRASAKIPADQ